MIARFNPQYSFREYAAAFSFWSVDSIRKYEKAFAEKFGCNHGVMFSHGRSGLYALFKIWGLEDTEVICPAYTCVVVQNAVILSGNRPVFVDCAQGHFNMDIEAIRTSVTPQTRVIIATHLFGYPMDIDAVQQIADEASKKYSHKVYVVQDCAHSYGAKWKGKLVSTYGDAAIFGCNISKIINSIFGGMVITSDKETDAALRKWKEDNLKKNASLKTIRRLIYFIGSSIAFSRPVYAFVNILERKGFLDSFVKYYEEDKIDFPGDWDQAPVALEARVGMVQLGRYDKIITERKKNARHIIGHFSNDQSIRFLPYEEEATYSHLVGIVADRDKWLKEYLEKGIQLGILIEYVVPLMKAYRKYDQGKQFPIADAWKDNTINFPVWKEINL